MDDTPNRLAPPTLNVELRLSPDQKLLVLRHRYTAPESGDDTFWFEEVLLLWNVAQVRDRLSVLLYELERITDHRRRNGETG